MPITRTAQLHVALCALNGVIMGLAWPPSPWCVMAPVLMVPFLLFWFPQRHRWLGTGMAYVFFLSFTLTTMRWMFQLQAGFAGMLLVVLAMLLIPVVQTLPYLVFRLSGTRLGSGYWLLLIPVLNALLEMVHYHGDLAFTWLHIGLSTSSAQLMTSGFSSWGFGGMSLLVYAANILAALAIVGWRNRARPWARTIAFALVVALLFVPLAPPAKPLSTHSMKVALAAPDYDPNKYSEDELYRHSRIIGEALHKASGRGVELVVFPEGFLRNFDAHPVLLDDWDSNPAIREIRHWCRSLRINLVTGAIAIKSYKTGEAASATARKAKNGTLYDVQNIVMLIDSAGEVQYRAKSRLVPFMERVPFTGAWSGLESWKLSINKAKGSYKEGEGLSYFDLQGLRILPLICYESLFDPEVSRAVKQDVDLIIEVSNEAWPAGRLMTEQHAAYAGAAAHAYTRPYLRSAVGGGTECFLCDERKTYVDLSQGRLLIADVPIIGVFQ